MNRQPSSNGPGRTDAAPSFEPARSSEAVLALLPAHFPAGSTTLVLPHHVRTRLDAWARAGYPDETCGLLIGRRAGDRIRVLRAVQARNLAREHRSDRFDLDPVAYVAADRDARAEGLAIVGVWHSHPDHPPVPSEADRGAAWANHSYLIATVGEHGMRELASYRLENGRFVRERLSE